VTVGGCRIDLRAGASEHPQPDAAHPQIFEARRTPRTLISVLQPVEFLGRAVLGPGSGRKAHR
jgi:hypothetical protein